jgi:hypothetical protein
LPFSSGPPVSVGVEREDSAGGRREPEMYASIWNRFSHIAAIEPVLR